VFQFGNDKYHGSQADLRRMIKELVTPNIREATLLLSVVDAEVERGNLFDRKRDMMAVLEEAGEWEPGKKHPQWSTFMVKNTNNPEWMDSVRLGYTNGVPPKTLKFKFIDDDGVGMDTVVGTATFDLHSMLGYKTSEPNPLGVERTCSDTSSSVLTGGVKMANICVAWWWAAEHPVLNTHHFNYEELRYKGRMDMLEKDCINNQMCSLPVHSLDVYDHMSKYNAGHSYPGVETVREETNGKGRRECASLLSHRTVYQMDEGRACGKYCASVG